MRKSLPHQQHQRPPQRRGSRAPVVGVEAVKCGAIAGLICFAMACSNATPQTSNTFIRASAGRSEIVITTTKRLAGAIHSLTWDGKEFINSTDHGRQLQSACSFDNSA